MKFSRREFLAAFGGNTLTGALGDEKQNTKQESGKELRVDEQIITDLVRDIVESADIQLAQIKSFKLEFNAFNTALSKLFNQFSDWIKKNDYVTVARALEQIEEEIGRLVAKFKEFESMCEQNVPNSQDYPNYDKTFDTSETSVFFKSFVKKTGFEPNKAETDRAKIASYNIKTDVIIEISREFAYQFSNLYFEKRPDEVPGEVTNVDSEEVLKKVEDFLKKRLEAEASTQQDKEKALKSLNIIKYIKLSAE